MIYIEGSNIEIIMLKNYMEEQSKTNEKEIEYMKNDLKKAMKDLSESELIVLEMYFYENKKEIEIAEILDIHQPNVNRLKRNPIRKLKGILVA